MQDIDRALSSPPPTTNKEIRNRIDYYRVQSRFVPLSIAELLCKSECVKLIRSSHVNDPSLITSRQASLTDRFEYSLNVIGLAFGGRHRRASKHNLTIEIYAHRARSRVRCVQDHWARTKTRFDVFCDASRYGNYLDVNGCCLQSRQRSTDNGGNGHRPTNDRLNFSISSSFNTSIHPSVRPSIPSDRRTLDDGTLMANTNGKKRRKKTHKLKRNIYIHLHVFVASLVRV